MTFIIFTLHRCIIFFKVFFSKTPLTSYIFWVQTYIRVEIHFLIQNLQSGDFGSYPGSLRSRRDTIFLSVNLKYMQTEVLV